MLCAGWERLNNTKPLVKYLWDHVLVLKCDLDVFWSIMLENILHSSTSILLLDFKFNLFFFPIKYLVIASTENDGSFCFEIRRQNRFAHNCVKLWDERGRKRASRSSSELHNTKSSLYLLKYALETFTFSWWRISLSSGVVTAWLAAIKQYLDLVYHADCWETWFPFVSRIALTRVSHNWAKLCCCLRFSMAAFLVGQNDQWFLYCRYLFFNILSQ